MDAIALLKADHDTMRELLARLDMTTERGGGARIARMETRRARAKRDLES